MHRAILTRCGPSQQNSKKALVAAEYVGVNLEIAKDFKMGETNQSPEFLKLNPAGKVLSRRACGHPI